MTSPINRTIPVVLSDPENVGIIYSRWNFVAILFTNLDSICTLEPAIIGFPTTAFFPFDCRPTALPLIL